jgi:hypothetical protein
MRTGINAAMLPKSHENPTGRDETDNGLRCPTVMVEESNPLQDPDRNTARLVETPCFAKVQARPYPSIALARVGGARVSRATPAKPHTDENVRQQSPRSSTKLAQKFAAAWGRK